MPADTVVMYAMESYRDIRRFQFSLDVAAEPTVHNVYQIFKYARDKFKLRGHGFIMLLAGTTYYIAKGSEKGSKNYQIFNLSSVEEPHATDQSEASQP